jgi:ribosomal protein S27AE
MRERRPKYSELSPNERKRSICRAYTNVLIKRGALKRGPCERCGTLRGVQAHHRDYSKPRLVRWLCGECHRALHRKKKPAAKHGLTLADVLRRHG